MPTAVIAVFPEEGIRRETAKRFSGKREQERNGEIVLWKLSRRLGHSKISVTLDTYSHATAPLDDAASDALESMFSAVNL